ncbi:MAG: iron ABC transporter permease, partial [Hyphomicrobiales bacterium]|nr:iron ABC transporter permease [Hyphomicrobiales bacterium]
MLHRRRLLISALAGILLVAFVLDIAIGPASLGAEQTFKALFGLDGASRTESVILWNLRLPQALTAILVGAALALAGAEMQ